MKNPKVLEIGSSENRIKDMEEFIEEWHAKNIYIIGRIAVFQDPYLTKDGRIWPSKKKRRNHELERLQRNGVA